MTRRSTHVVPHQAGSVWFGVAVGTSTRASAGRRSATTTTRRTASTASGSVPSSPQVSELNSESGAGDACLRSGYENGKRVRLEEEKPA